MDTKMSCEKISIKSPHIFVLFSDNSQYVSSEDEDFELPLNESTSTEDSSSDDNNEEDEEEEEEEEDDDDESMIESNDKNLLKGKILLILFLNVEITFNLLGKKQIRLKS